MPKKRKPFAQLTVSEDGIPTKRSKACEEDEASSSQRRAGTITFMVLKNFMCHSLLEVKFTNNVSIIIGKNGSGKSAILTALIVGLGGKASLTNRGSSVKGFVKAGKNSGKIEIELCNEGPMAYRPKIYGKRITISRNFTVSGSSTYRIKSEAGEVISTQAKEIHNITDSLNIQVDNPVCILNQDTSRNFLSSNDPKHKFNLFMRATRLQTLSDEYQKIHNNKRDSVRMMTEKQESFRKLQEEIRRLKGKIDGHKSIVNLKDKKKNLQIEIMWAKVRDSEQELQQKEAKVENVEQKHSGLKENCDKRIDKVNKLQENIGELEQKKLELKESIQVQSRPQLDLKRQLDEVYDTYCSKKAERQSADAAIRSKIQDTEYLEQEIANANKNMSLVEQQKMQRIRDFNQLQDKIKGMDDHLETSKNDLFQIKSELSRKEEDEENLLREIKQMDHKITNEKNSLAAIRRESGNSLLLYGRDMPKVKQMIAQYKNKFDHKPRGPLGSYIKLKDKKWAVAVEGYLSPATLGAFVVDNNKDNKLLREIFQKVWTGGRQPAIITSKFVFQKHDVISNLVQAPSDCVSLYNAIDIDDVVAANCIVDQSGPENILLIPSNDRAIELLSQRQKVPRNCYQGVTIKGDKYYPDPNYKTYGSRYHRAQYLQVDTKEYMEQLQQNISEYTRKKETIVQQLNTFRQDMQKQVNTKNQLEDKIRQLHGAKVNVKRKLDDLKSTAEPEVQNVQVLENELKEIKVSLDQKKASLDKIAEEIKKLKVEITDKRETLHLLTAASKNLEDRLEPLNEQIRELKTKQKEISTSDEFDKSRIKDLERKLNEARSAMVIGQQVVRKQTDEAVAIGERPEEIRIVPDISFELNEVNRSIARIETDTENVTDVFDKYKELYNKFKNSSEILKGLQSDVQELNLALEKRSRYYKLTESYFITFMKHSFKKVLEYRQFKGTLDIDMDAKKLELIVIPQQGSQGLTTTSNLSGGERSFSTVAFLYALWQCMDFPFYFLDEFDVYMDKLNRTKVIDILLHHAKSRPTLQFVFLTPQDVSFINKDVTILRLQDPERFNV